MTAPAPLTTADFADLFPGQQVIVTPLQYVTDPDKAVVYWDAAANEGVAITPLYSDKDRAFLAERIERIRKEQTDKP